MQGEAGMIGKQLVGVAIFIAAACGSRAWAQAACSDSFAVADVGEGKTWRFVSFDKSTFGAATVADGKLTLAGRGADIYGAKNEFVTAYRSDIQGDFDVSVKLISQDSTHDWAQAGIVAATDLNDLTKGGYVAVDISPGHGYTVFYDKTAPAGQLDGNSGAGKTVYPAWLRLAKKGTQYTAYYRTQESASWTALPTPPQSLNTGANAQIGLFSVSHSATQTGKAVFDDFTCLHVPATAIAPRGGGRLAPKIPGFLPAAMIDALGKVRQGAGDAEAPVMIFRK
jgi:regulation of enolase protein 1 (concanavalin A-like superfamily)